jgi:hypothetical protein
MVLARAARVPGLCRFLVVPLLNMLGLLHTSVAEACVRHMLAPPTLADHKGPCLQISVYILLVGV